MDEEKYLSRCLGPKSLRTIALDSAGPSASTLKGPIFTRSFFPWGGRRTEAKNLHSIQHHGEQLIQNVLVLSTDLQLAILCAFIYFNIAPVFV